MSPNTKKILIETESLEVFRLRVVGAEIARLYCEHCEKIEETLDLNSAADISRTTARDLLQRVQAGQIHTAESASGHFLICRCSLEEAINQDARLRPYSFELEENR